MNEEETNEVSTVARVGGNAYSYKPGEQVCASPSLVDGTSMGLFENPVTRFKPVTFRLEL